jgi:hypothetical protein
MGSKGVAFGPPRSGFVLRGCIGKADEAWGEVALDDGLADQILQKAHFGKLCGQTSYVAAS